MKTVIGIVLFLGWGLGALASESLQEGDLIFLSMPCQACQLIELTTHSAFSLVGILTQDDSQWNVIMAGEPAVGMVPLTMLVTNANRPPVVKRMKTAEGQEWARQAVRVAKDFIGTPYSPDFTWGTGSLYCSELVYFSFFIASGRRASPFVVRAMNFEPYTSQWAVLLGHSPPQGQPGISPEDISESQDLEPVL